MRSSLQLTAGEKDYLKCTVCTVLVSEETQAMSTQRRVQVANLFFVILQTFCPHGPSFWSLNIQFFECI